MLGTLQQLAERVGGRVVGEGSLPIARIAAVEEATDDALTFATDERYLAAALSSAAAAVLVDASVTLVEPLGKPAIVVENARLALSRLLRALRPPRPAGPFRHPSAIVDPSAQVAADAYIDALAYVGAHARIGRGSVIGVGAHVGAHTVIGEETWLHPRATVLEGCEIGNRVALHAGCVIGSEGFGWAFVDGRLERIPQVGNVVLDDEVEIGANTCIDRAQTGSTRVGRGSKIDNLVQVGHNCRIGQHCAIAAQSGFAGSTTLGDFVKVAGQSGTRGHMHIGTGATIAGKAGVWGDVADGAMVSGNPARDHRDQLKREVMIRGLPKLIARVDALERERKRESP